MRGIMDNAWHTMRASDADRARATDTVRAALAEGRIDWAEHSSRIDQILRARTYGELHNITFDLPAGLSPLPAAPTHPPAQIWPAAAPAVSQKTNELALASMICGVLSFATGITAIAAIITGHMALSKINRTGEQGRGLAITGLLLGYAVAIGGTLLLILGTFLFVATGI